MCLVDAPTAVVAEIEDEPLHPALFEPAERVVQIISDFVTHERRYAHVTGLPVQHGGDRHCSDVADLFTPDDALEQGERSIRAPALDPERHGGIAVSGQSHIQFHRTAGNDRLAIDGEELIPGEQIRLCGLRTGDDAGDDRRAINELPVDGHREQLALAECTLPLRLQPNRGNDIGVRIRGSKHSVDRLEDELVRIERVRVVLTQVIQDAAEHLDVFVERALFYYRSTTLGRG